MTARWLLDLEEFNEWMNEEDYLVEEEVRYSTGSSRASRVSTVQHSTSRFEFTELVFIHVLCYSCFFC